jgi:hypothetical protein
MPYHYIVETTHGDRELQSNYSHENHPGGWEGFWNDIKPVVKTIHDDLIALAGPAVQLLALRRGGPAGKGAKVADLK